MALQSAIPVSFEAFFPAGAFMIGEVERAIEWSDKGEQVGQQHDKTTNKPVWLVRVIDADPNARKGQNEVTVKVAAAQAPDAPPQANGMPFRPIVFEDLCVTPYVKDANGRARIAYSLRASGMRAPGGARGRGE